MEIHQHPAMRNNKIKLKRPKKAEQKFILGDESKLEIQMPPVKLDTPPAPPTYTIAHTDIIFSPDDSRILVNKIPREGLSILDAHDGTEKAHFEQTEKDNFEKIMWSKLGAYVASVSKPIISQPNADSTFRLWNSHTNKIEFERKINTSLVEFSPKDTYLALGSQDGQMIDVISLVDKKKHGSLKFRNNSIAFSPDERFLAYYSTRTGNSEFEIIEMATGKTIAKIPGSTLAFSPSCKHIIAFDSVVNALHLYNAETFVQSKEAKTNPIDGRYHHYGRYATAPMQFMRFNGDGNQFLISQGNQDEIWTINLESLGTFVKDFHSIFPQLTKTVALRQFQLLIEDHIKKPFAAHETRRAQLSSRDCLADAKISPDEKYVLGLISSQKVFLYNLQRYKTKILGSARTLDRFQFSPNSKYLAHISTDKTDVWNLD